MFIELLRPEWLIPNGSGYILARLKLLSRPGQAHRLLAGDSRFMGRLNTKGAGLDNIQILTAGSDHWGAGETGVPFGAGLDLSNTSAQGGSNTPLYPYLRLRVNGTVADGDTSARLILACAAPLYGIEVIEAAAGLPFQAGQDLIRSDLGIPPLVTAF